MSHVLIIESDGDLARRMTGVCRELGWRFRLVTDALEGLTNAVADEPAAILLDAADARLGSETLVDELRRYNQLCWIPLAIIGGTSRYGPPIRGADCVIKDSGSPALENHLRRVLQRWIPAPAVPQPPVKCSVTVGDIFCDGNLFRRRGSNGDLFELSITEGALWLLPITRDADGVRFDDPMALFHRFAFVPWA